MKARHEFTSESEYREYLKRYYAGLAMQGLLASTQYEGLGNAQSKQITEEAVYLATDLIAALSKP